MIAAIPGRFGLWSDLRRLFPGVAFSGINTRRCCCTEVPRQCCAPISGQFPSLATVVISGNLPCSLVLHPADTRYGYIPAEHLNGAFELRRETGTRCVFLEGDLVRPLFTGTFIGGSIGGLKLLPDGITLIDFQTGATIPNWPMSYFLNMKLYRRIALSVGGPNPAGESFATLSWTYYTSLVFTPGAVAVQGGVFSSRVPSIFSCPGGQALNQWVPTNPPVHPELVGCAHWASPFNFEQVAVGHSGTATFALA